MAQGKAGASVKRRRRLLGAVLAVLVVGAVAGVLLWQGAHRLTADLWCIADLAGGRSHLKRGAVQQCRAGAG